MQPYVEVSCPYCGETIGLVLDASAGEQSYIEDCQVCCRPIAVTVAFDEEGEADLSVSAENDT